MNEGFTDPGYESFNSNYHGSGDARKLFPWLIGSLVALIGGGLLSRLFTDWVTS